MALYAFVRGFRIRKDKIPYYDIERLRKANKWVIQGVCKNGFKTFRIFMDLELKRYVRNLIFKFHTS